MDLDRLSSYHFVTVAHDDAGTLEGRKIAQDSAEWFWCRHQHYGIDMTTKCFLDLVSSHPRQQLTFACQSLESGIGTRVAISIGRGISWSGGRQRDAAIRRMGRVSVLICITCRGRDWIYFRSLEHQNIFDRMFSFAKIQLTFGTRVRGVGLDLYYYPGP